MTFSSPKERSRPWLLGLRSSETFIVTLITIAIFTDIFLYSMIIPMLPKALVTRTGVPEQDVQYWISILLGTYGATLLIGSPLFGYFADHYRSRRTPFVLGLIALATSTTLFALAVSPAALLLARAFQGLSAAAVWVVGLAWIVDNVSQDRIGEAMGNTAMGMTLGYLIGPMVGGVAYEKLGYYSMFALPTLLILVQIVLQFALIEKSVAKQWLDNVQDPENNNANGTLTPTAQLSEETPLLAQHSIPANGSQATIFHMLRSPRLPVALFTITFTTVIQCALESTLPLFVMETFHWSSTGAGLIFLAISIPTLAGTLAGKMVDRLGSRGPGSVSFAVTGLALFSLRFIHANTIPNKTFLCALLAIIGFTSLVAEIIAMTEVFQAVEEFEECEPGIFGDKSPIAQAYGLFTMAAAAGQLSGPILGGFLQIHMGWSGMTLMCGIICALAALPVGFFSGSRPKVVGDE